MALTNRALKEILASAGVDEANIKSTVAAIMAGHNETVEVLTEERDTARQERDTYKAEAEKLPGIQKELDTLRAAKWEEKYNAEHTALENLKTEVAAKESRAAKETAVRAYLESKKITGKALDIAMLSVAAQIDAAELTKDGKIKDTAALDGLISGTLAPLVTTETTIPAESPPTANVKSTPGFKNLSDAMVWQNAHPDTPVNLDQFFPAPVPPAVPPNLYATGSNVNAGGMGNPYVTSPLMPAT